MIVIDTHIFLWWVHDINKLSAGQISIIEEHESSSIGLSIISCWEIAKLVEKKRLILPMTLKEWFDMSLSYPGIKVIELTTDIIIESTHLPGNFHRDPADQIIVATGRVNTCSIVTSDEKLLKYPYVKTVF